MTEVVSAPAPAAAKASIKKLSRPKGTTLTELIVKVVSAFDERSGVSAAALKKALTAGGYDVEKNNSWVKSAIKSLVTKGTLVQIKGIGAWGSFRMSKTGPKAKKPAAKKPAAAKNTKTAAVKKPAAAAKKSPKKAKKPAVDKKTTLSEVIVKVVSASDERSGVSAPSVMKALAARGYDVEKKKTRIKTAIKSLVTKRTLIQTKGTGASGSFKMNKTPPKAKKPAAKKPTAAKKTKTVAVKKPAAAAKKSPKKAKKPAAVKKTMTAAVKKHVCVMQPMGDGLSFSCMTDCR